MHVYLDEKSNRSVYTWMKELLSSERASKHKWESEAEKKKTFGKLSRHNVEERLTISCAVKPHHTQLMISKNGTHFILQKAENNNQDEKRNSASNIQAPREKPKKDVAKLVIHL